MKFLFITRTAWDEPPRARHQLARALAKRYEVVFVALNVKGKPGLNIDVPEENITLVLPTWHISGKYVFRLPIINEMYQQWLFKQLQKKYSSYSIINFDPSASLIHNYFKDVVYFCNDNFIDRKRSKSILISLYYYFTQRAVAKKARFCTGVAVYLQDLLKKHNNRSFLLLTGASKISTAFKYVQDDSDKKHIIYVGWLSKLNADWVIHLAENSNYLIHLIGPYQPKQIKKFLGIENIIVAGERRGDELHSYLSKADVCIAPYLYDKDTEKVYTMPNKFWLYLNFGKPIVSCTIKNLYQLPEGFVYQAEEVADFCEKIDVALQQDTAILQQRRKKFIDSNLWENRTNELLKLYKKY
jgi:glycosyltransferase involved in cell wall biosynthesis